METMLIHTFHESIKRARDQCSGEIGVQGLLLYSYLISFGRTPTSSLGTRRSVPLVEKETHRVSL